MRPLHAASGVSDFALTRAGTISGYPSNCKRVRYRKDNCRRCVEICPADAISLSPGPTISQACTQCGLCVAACPTEVFRDDNRREQRLWEGAVQLKESLVATGQKTVLSVRCQRVRAGRDSSSINCLGNMTASFMAALALLGLDELILTKGDCSRCDLEQGGNLLLRSVRIVRSFLGGTRYAGFVIHLQNDSRKEPLAGRRHFLSPLVTIFRRTQRGSTIKETQVGADARSGRELFYQLLSAAISEGEGEFGYCRDLPWAVLTIDETLCSGCGICTAVCPTGALVADPESSHRSFRFSSALCLNCGLCSDACSKRAIRFPGESVPVDIFTCERKVVATIQMGRCELCGDRISAAKTGLCPTCERRQLSQTYIPRHSSRVESGTGRSQADRE